MSRTVFLNKSLAHTAERGKALKDDLNLLVNLRILRIRLNFNIKSDSQRFN